MVIALSWLLLIILNSLTPNSVLAHAIENVKNECKKIAERQHSTVL